MDIQKYLEYYDLYNEKEKIEYLSQLELSDGSIRLALMELSKAQPIEEQFNKDLYLFNDLEIKDLIRSLGSTTVVTLRSTISIYKTYTDWAIKTGKRKNMETYINEYANFQKTANISDYTAQTKINAKFLSEEQIMDLIDMLVNPVDQLLIALPYNFITGEQMEYARAVKMENLNRENNVLTIKDEQGIVVREQEIPQYLVDIMEQAESVDSYLVGNGLAENVTAKERKLAHTDYLIRPLRRKDNEGKISSYGFLHSKMVNIKEYTGYEHITPIAIQQSRFFHIVEDMMEKTGENDASIDTFRKAFDYVEHSFGVEFTEMQEYNLRLLFRKYNEIRV